MSLRKDPGLFRGFDRNFTELLHQFGQLESGFTGTSTGCFVVLCYLELCILLECFVLLGDLCQKCFHNAIIIKKFSGG